MRSVEVDVRSESGLHARPAAAFVRAATTYASKIRLENLTVPGLVADAKSITSVLSAGVEKGHLVRIEAEGADEGRAVEGLGRLLDGFPERAGQ